MIDQEDGGETPQEDERDRREVILAFSSVVETISRSMVQVFSRNLAPEGITLLQYHALRAITTFGPELDMSSIAAMTGLPASSITSIIDRLHERALVERHHHSTDRRRVVATMTEDGAALMRRIQDQEFERLELLLVTSTTEEVAICLKVFQDIELRMHELFDTRLPGETPPSR